MAARGDQINWPLPAGVLAGGNEGRAEICVATGIDGITQTGLLLRFLPHDGVIEMHPRGAAVSLHIELDALRSLRLTRLLSMIPVSAVPDPAASVPPAHLAVPPAPGVAFNIERYWIEFLTGPHVTGETLGCIDGEKGLFLFLVHQANKISRVFVPHVSIKSFWIGELDKQSPPLELAPEELALVPVNPGPVELTPLDTVQAEPAPVEAVPAESTPVALTLIELVPVEPAPVILVPNEPASMELRPDSQPAFNQPLIGELLIDANHARPEDIDAGLQLQRGLREKRVGEYLTADQIITPENLAHALKRQQFAPVLKLGEALIQNGVVSAQQLQQALERQQRERQLPLGDILVEMGVIERHALRKILAWQLGIPYVDLSKFSSRDPRAFALISAEIGRRLMAVPLYLTGDTVVVAMEDPVPREPRQELAFFAGRKIEAVMASAADILRELDLAYGAVPVAREETSAEIASQLLVEMAEAEGANGAATEEEEQHHVSDSDSTLVRLVNKLILDAIEQGASDIHIETYPAPHPIQVRIRKDGTLVNHLEIPALYRSALVSRIKIMCQLDIAERRKPQDGKLDFQKFSLAKVELRVATIPTANGLEDVVLRVLAAGKPILLDRLDLSPANLASLIQIAARPHGLFLVCGPTGSGKTTTLHSVLNHVNIPGRKIWTAEDPIEITQAGLRQVQMNPKIGWNFAAAMRTFLRADPDIIMLGEIRDDETARIAIQGSLTGHFVYSTLHTNSAPESIVRLLDLGADPFNFADALRGVLAQRLAKRLCTHCRQARIAASDEIADLAVEYCAGGGLEPASVVSDWQARHASPSGPAGEEGAVGEARQEGRITLYAATGCAVCNQTGYRGRIGLHELFVVKGAAIRQIQTRAPVAELLATAIEQGMRTLKQDGIEKILLGLTDIVQIHSVCA